MRECPRCGSAVADDVDFCSCGAFLDWDSAPATNVEGGDAVPAAAPEAALTTVVRPPTTKEVKLDLLGPGGEPVVGELKLTVEPGNRVTFIARVRNQSRIVDSYKIAVEGLPEGWCTIGPPTVGTVARHAETAYLLPLGSQQGYEEDVVVAVHPPRSPYASAGIHAFSVVAISQTEEYRSDRAQASVDVAPFWEISAAPRPAVAAGRRRGVFEGGVANTGNVPVPATLAGTDRAGLCRLKVTPAAPVLIVNGTVQAFKVVVTPRRPHLFGRAIDHTLEMNAGTVGEKELSAPFLPTYRQRPWIPWWALLLVLLLAIAGLIVFLLWPHPKTVPDVRNSRTAFVAQQRLEKAGLTLNPSVRTALQPRARAGTVIAQAPAPGKKVDKGKQVTVVVAAGHGMVRVPRLRGLKATMADQKLQQHGLTLGAVQPKLAPGMIVGSQLPHAGARRRRGTPVSVVLAKPKPAKKKGGKAGTTGGAAKKVPAAGGMTAAAATAALKKGGLTAVPVLQISTVKPGSIVTTIPAVGQPPPLDKKVTLIISAGFPKLAYDAPPFAFTTGGAFGQPTKPLARAATVASGGAWTPNGALVAYTKPGKLFIERPKPHARAKRIKLPPGLTPTNASFAPDLDRTVLAFVGAGGASSSDTVCWIDLTNVATATPKPSCLRRSDWDPRRTWRLNGFAWSKKGKVLLVEAADTLAVGAPGHRFGLFRLSTQTAPFSTNRNDWSVSTSLVTPTHQGRGVLAAAYSPDGKQLAVVANLWSSDYRVALAKATDEKLDKPNGLPLPGCDVAWRPDGAELAVVQSGSSCLSRTGPIARTSVADPRLLRTVVLSGQHPAWQPVDLSLGPGRAPAPGTQP